MAYRVLCIWLFPLSMRACVVNSSAKDGRFYGLQFFERVHYVMSNVGT